VLLVVSFGLFHQQVKYFCEKTASTQLQEDVFLHVWNNVFIPFAAPTKGQILVFLPRTPTRLCSAS
jgi:alanyl-tRNA synthetase